MNVIEIKNLTKLYGNGRGIRNLNLTVEQGDILGLLGPNGSGKTTAMKAILNLVNAEGSVKVFGMDLHDNFENIMKRTGALIESPAIYKDLSAYQNVKMHANMYPNVDRKRIEHILDVVHLLPYKNDKAGKFSLGMKQRLGLAVAFVSNPDLIILDEPVNGLDIEGVVEVREIIKKLNAEKNVTFLISSHMAGEIEKTCNKVAVIYESELIATSTTEDALRLHPSMEDYFLSVVKYLVLTVLGAIICILRIGGNVLVSKITGGEVVIKSNLIMEMVGFVFDILVPLIIFMAVTDLFASEVQEDSMKASLLRPLTRFKVMTSKSLAVLVLGCMVTLAMFVISLIVQIVSGNSLRSVPITFAAYLINMIPLIAIVSMALLINMISKSPTLAMLLCIVVYVFFKYLNYYITPVGQMVFTAYSQWHKIWIGNVLPFTALISKIGILFGSILILYTLSYIIFDSKDY